MKRILYSFLILLLFTNESKAQNFINKATIEFEVKTSIKKTMGTGMWEEMMKDQMPDFKTGYFQFIFDGDISIYKFNRWAEGKKMPEFMRKSEEENTWYFDHKVDKFYMQKNIYGSNFNVQDSLPRINWKLSNENRMIAGFNCRKAVGIIMDSVYVFAFFTEEIMISGGPCSINGLPGMVLGLTIPRLYTSYIATKVMINSINTAEIKPTTAKSYYTNATLKTTLLKRSEDWGDADDPDRNKWKEQFLWNAFL